MDENLRASSTFLSRRLQQQILLPERVDRQDNHRSLLCETPSEILSSFESGGIPGHRADHEHDLIAERSLESDTPSPRVRERISIPLCLSFLRQCPVWLRSQNCLVQFRIQSAAYPPCSRHHSDTDPRASPAESRRESNRIVSHSLKRVLAPGAVAYGVNR